ncbi:MAG TPA: DUF2007 domain-containing protein [Candidatus Hydrogenedentes bacterium]|nr:DUF2007 domain-containing protein [Candidatus Hydrogenedentota bacterium]
MKTVFVAPNQTVLMVVKSRLESEGIKCFTKNDYLQEILGMGRIGGLNIVGALELQVALKDVKKAKKILDITPPLKKAQAKSKAKPTARIPPKAKPKARAKKTPEVTRPLKKKKK